MTTQQDIEAMVAEAAKRLPAGTCISMQYQVAHWTGGQAWFAHCHLIDAKISAGKHAADPQTAINQAVDAFMDKHVDLDRAYAGICGNV